MSHAAESKVKQARRAQSQQGRQLEVGVQGAEGPKTSSTVYLPAALSCVPNVQSSLQMAPNDQTDKTSHRGPCF